MSRWLININNYQLKKYMEKAIHVLGAVDSTQRIGPLR